MNKKTYLILGGLIGVIVLIVAYQLYVTHKAALPYEATTPQTVANTELSFSFSYPKGSDAFTLLEPNGTDKGIIKSYIMMPSAAYEGYKSSGGDAPAAMNVFVFNLQGKNATSSETNSRITELQNWAADNSTLSSIKQAKTTPDVVALDGIKTLHYQADGLYQQDIYLVSYKGYVYMFVGQYDKQTDSTYTAFQDLIKTISFN